MSQTIARRYAQALYAEATAKDHVAQVDADMGLIAESLAGSRDLQLFFRSPVINREKKNAIIEKLFAGKLSATTSNLLALLLNKGRESLVGDIAQAYRLLRNDQLGIVEAEARVAYAMDEADQNALKAKLEALTGKQVSLRVKQDEKLIGGAVVRVGDMVYDGSIRTQLRALSERLTTGSFLNN